MLKNPKLPRKTVVSKPSMKPPGRSSIQAPIQNGSKEGGGEGRRREEEKGRKEGGGRGRRENEGRMREEEEGRRKEEEGRKREEEEGRRREEERGRRGMREEAGGKSDGDEKGKVIEKKREEFVTIKEEIKQSEQTPKERNEKENENFASAMQVL